MSDKFAIDDDGPNDGSTLDSYATTEAAVLEPNGGAGTANVEWTGARCEKCEARLVSDVVSVCPHCGWYGSLGSYVEIDPEWETDSETKPAAAQTARPTHLQVWLGLMPRWSWIIIASVLFVMVESVIARLVTPADSWIRTTWSLGQLAIGLLAAVGCHVFNFLVIVGDDADVGLLDLLLKPLKLWGRAVASLPRRLWVADGAASGLTAAVLSVIVIGGIPYDRLWDWGLKQPPKHDLMGAVMNQIEKNDNDKGSDDLAQSINDLASNKGDEPKDDKIDPPKPHENTDCVILGYVLDRDGKIATLILGTTNGGQLVYAGNVAPKLPEDEMKRLAESLKSIESQRPIIRVEYEATWVQPKYTCRVSFGQRSKSGRLRDIEWNKLLGSIEKR